MTKENNFTFLDGIAVQQDQIRQWGLVLLPNVHAAMLAKAEEENTIASADNKSDNGHDVWRGTEISNWLSNTFMCNK